MAGGYVTGLKDSRVWITLEFKVNMHARSYAATI